MSKKSLIFCLVVVAALFVGLTLYRQKWKNREYVDLQTIKWTQMGSFSEFNNKEVVEFLGKWFKEEGITSQEVDNYVSSVPRVLGHAVLEFYEK